MLLGTDIGGRAGHAGADAGGRDRHQLLDRAPSTCGRRWRISASTRSRPISCLPNAGLPQNVDGQAVYPLQPDEFAREMADFVERFSLNAVGGCCGTTPEHIRALAARLPSRGARARGRRRRWRSCRRG